MENEIKVNATTPSSVEEVSQTPAPTPKKRGRKAKAPEEKGTATAPKAEKAKEQEKAPDASAFDAILNRNAVPGFNPYNGVFGYRQEDGSVRLKMPAHVAMAWFLTRYPGGSANIQLLEKFSTERYAVFSCQLVDKDGIAIGFPGIGSCAWSNQDDVHRNFVRSAQTKAIDSALKNNGFCAPFDSHKTDSTIIIGDDGLVEDDDPSAQESKNQTAEPAPEPAPVSKPAEPESSAAKDDNPPPTVDELKKSGVLFSGAKLAEKKPAPAAGPAIMVEDDPAPVMASEHSETENEPAASDSAPQLNKPDVPENVDTSMPLEDAMNFVVPMGPYKGSTMKDVVEAHGCGPIRFLTGKRYIGTDAFRAAKTVCGYYNG